MMKAQDQWVLTLASWLLRFFLCPYLLFLGDQQTSNRSFRHCPIPGDELNQSATTDLTVPM